MSSLHTCDKDSEAEQDIQYICCLSSGLKILVVEVVVVWLIHVDWNKTKNSVQTYISSGLQENKLMIKIWEPAWYRSASFGYLRKDFFSNLFTRY